MKSGRVKDLLQQIKQLVEARRYRVKIHAVQHMIEEDFNEAHIVEAIVGRSRILEDYPDESRCLVLGYFHFTEKAESPLHVVCDYSAKDVIDFVTAYIPRRPWWITTTRRRKRK